MVHQNVLIVIFVARKRRPKITDLNDSRAFFLFGVFRTIGFLFGARAKHFIIKIHIRGKYPNANFHKVKADSIDILSC